MLTKVLNIQKTVEPDEKLTKESWEAHISKLNRVIKEREAFEEIESNMMIDMAYIVLKHHQPNHD